jgi:hypothetical protein
MKAYLSGRDTPAGSIFNEKGNTWWASCFQRMVRVEEELREGQVIGDEGGRLRGNDFGHGLRI